MKNKLSKKFRTYWYLIYISLLSLFLILHRINVGDPKLFYGNAYSLILTTIIFFTLIATFILRKYDYFIVTWLSFYFASPTLKLPFLTDAWCRTEFPTFLTVLVTSALVPFLPMIKPVSPTCPPDSA